MKRFSEQLKKRADSVRLSAIERRDLRERLESYMEYHPLPSQQSGAQTSKVKQRVGSTATAIRIDLFQIGKFLGTFAAIALVAVPLMAEKSVPGDILYPVKVQFNEEVRSTLSLSPYAKVEWETKRLERRIAEARLLASEGKLTPEVEQEVAEAVKEHSNAAQQEIATLRQSDNDEATIAEIAFASALDVQSEVLSSDIQKGAAAATMLSGNSVLAIAGAVDEVLKTASAQSGEGVSYDKLMARVELETTRAYEYFDTVKRVASEEEKNDIERRLQDIERKVKEASELSRGSGGSAPRLAIALADTRKLISFMTNIDVRENVTINDLLPVTLTVEERTAAVNKTLEEVARLQKMVEEIMPELRVDVAEKAAAGLDELIIRVGTVDAALAAGDIDNAEVYSTEVLKLARELTTLTKVEIYDEAGNVVEVPVATSTPNTTATTTASTTNMDLVTGE